MTEGNGAEPRDPLLRDSFNALQRAAERARQEAIRTGTDLIVVRDGRIVRLSPVDLTEVEPTEPQS